MIVPPPGLKIWLDHPTSITDKLKTYHSNVYLTCLSQDWATQDPWEQQHIPATKIFRREILMYAAEDACWYARTMIPETTYLLDQSRFERLKTEPLGQIIWHASDIQRQNMIQFSLHQISLLYQYIAQIPQLKISETYLWGRLSTFIIKQQLPFYLLEIFLPELQHYYDHTSSDTFS